MMLLWNTQKVISKTPANVEIYPEKAVGVGEHPDVLEAIEKELAVIAQYP